MHNIYTYNIIHNLNPCLDICITFYVYHYTKHFFFMDYLVLFDYKVNFKNNG